ncbi:hypothetical protein [Sphingomonas sp. DT-204]
MDEIDRIKERTTGARAARTGRAKQAKSYIASAVAGARSLAETMNVDA